MKKLFIAMILISASFTFLGCSYNAQVTNTSAPVSEIRADRQMDYSASCCFNDDIGQIDRKVTPASWTCRATSFPLNTSQALQNSIIEVLEGTFKKVNQCSTQTKSDNGGRYKFIFSLDSFQPTLHFDSRLFDATIFASAEIVMKVTVLDSSGNEVIRTTISGNGSMNSSGQCSAGAQVLAGATQEAIEGTLEELVYKVINSDYLVSK